MRLSKLTLFQTLLSITFLNSAFAQSPVRSVQSLHGPVERMCFTPEAKRLVTVHEYEAMVVWNASTGYKMEEYLAFQNPLTAVACSRDGRYIAAAGGDSLTRLFDGRYLNPLRDLRGHQHWIYFLRFTNDSKYLLSASTDRTIIMWDPATGKQVRTFEGHEQWIWVMELSPDGKHFVSGAAEEEMFLWDIETGKIVRKFYGHRNGVFGLAYSPDGKTLASASWDGSVRIWNPETGNETKVIKTDELNDCLLFSPDGKWLILGMKSGFVHIYNTKTWQRHRRFSGHSKGVEDLAFWGGNNNDKYLVTCGDDGYVKWWDFSNLIKGKPGFDG
jgi:WD40 repeat protein